ncbi:hypothetical protein [Chroococcidiopsis cubana]|nr:hypothetical protein [Chroococcidiopsis cubana]
MVAGIVIQHFIEQGVDSVIIHHSTGDRLTPTLKITRNSYQLSVIREQ